MQFLLQNTSNCNGKQNNFLFPIYNKYQCMHTRLTAYTHPCSSMHAERGACTPPESTNCYSLLSIARRREHAQSWKGGRGPFPCDTSNSHVIKTCSDFLSPNMAPFLPGYEGVHHVHGVVAGSLQHQPQHMQHNHIQPNFIDRVIPSLHIFLQPAIWTV